MSMEYSTSPFLNELGFGQCPDMNCWLSEGGVDIDVLLVFGECDGGYNVFFFDAGHFAHRFKADDVDLVFAAGEGK